MQKRFYICSGEEQGKDLHIASTELDGTAELVETTWEPREEPVTRFMVREPQGVWASYVMNPHTEDEPHDTFEAAEAALKKMEETP